MDRVKEKISSGFLLQLELLVAPCILMHLSWRKDVSLLELEHATHTMKEGQKTTMFRSYLLLPLH